MRRERKFEPFYWQPRGNPVRCAPGGACSPEPTRQHLSLAMAYVPDQEWRDIYSDEEGTKRGTIFCELDKPWIGGSRCD